MKLFIKIYLLIIYVIKTIEEQKSQYSKLLNIPR